MRFREHRPGEGGVTPARPGSRSFRTLRGRLSPSWRRCMLHRTPLILLAAAAIASVAGRASAQQSEPRPRMTVPSPFMGRWELDLTRMPSTYGPPPKRVVYDFQDIGGGKSRLTVDITGQDGSVR